MGGSQGIVLFGMVVQDYFWYTFCRKFDEFEMFDPPPSTTTTTLELRMHMHQFYDLASALYNVMRLYIHGFN